MKADRPRGFFVGKQRPDITADGPSAFPLKLSTRTHQKDFGPWLSGFIESEGGFEKNGHLRFTIDQKWDQPILETIRDFLGCGRSPRRGRRKQREHMFRLVVNSDRQKVIQHCDKFPLRSIKSSDFIKWKETLAIPHVMHPELPLDRQSDRNPPETSMEARPTPEPEWSVEPGPISETRPLALARQRASAVRGLLYPNH